MTATAAGQEIMVLDRVSGEQIDVKTADDPTLCRFVTNLAELREQLGDAEKLVHGEIVSRLDKGGKWTASYGDVDGILYEVSAPSPEAGTATFPPDLLEPILRKLVEGDAITEAAAETALQRRVTVTLKVPWNKTVEEVVDQALKDERTVTATGNVTSTAAGIKALLKISDSVKRAIGRAQKRMPTPPRKAKVKVKERKP